jgi:Ice-binding-like
MVRRSRGSKMKLSKYEPNARRTRFGVASVAALGLLVAIPASAQAATAPVPLGTASSFVVLAGAGITNTGNTTLNGDIGTFPTPSISGLSTLTLNGTNYAADAVTQGAKKDLTTAYTTAAGAGPTTAIPVQLDGKTLKPGVYSGGALHLGQFGRLTLDGGRNPNAVFIFKSASTLDAAENSAVVLTNGASSCNVFWQVTSSATLRGSTFVGTIMALTDIHLQSDITHQFPADNSVTVVDGRALAINGAVTLETSTVTDPTCKATPTPTATRTPTAQIKQVPKGAVRTGDGSTSGGGNDLPGLLAGVLLFAGVAARRSSRHVGVVV